MKLLLITLTLFSGIFLSAQIMVIPNDVHACEGHPTVSCTGHHTANPIYVPPPKLLLRSAPRSRFEFVYDEDAPDYIKPAVEFAGEIWGHYLISEIPIRVRVRWYEFEEPDRPLGTGRPWTYILFRNDSIVPKANVAYPIALAESLINRNIEVGEDDLDIIIFINNRQKWYLGLDGKVPPEHYDLVSLVLHEIGHGLGFIASSRETDDGMGGLWTVPRIHDTFLKTFSGNHLTDTLVYPNPSFELLDQFTSEAIFFENNGEILANGRRRERMYAPSEFSQGSSLHHLDWDPRMNKPLNEIALMDPFSRTQEAVQRPGPIDLAMLAAMGWKLNFEPNFIEPTTEDTSKELMLFPNPAIDELQISWPKGIPLQVNYQIIDVSGRIVQIGQIGKNLALPLKSINPGYYYLRLQDEQIMYHGKFVVSKK